MARKRKTRDVWEVRGNYGYGHGWECVTAEVTRKEALARLREYRENEPGVPFKLVKTREEIIDINETCSAPPGAQERLEAIAQARGITLDG